LKSTRAYGYDRLLTRLKLARKEASLTQEKLAKKLRRPQSFVSKYENAEQRLDVVEFVEVTRALGIDASEALTLLTEAGGPQAARKR